MRSLVVAVLLAWMPLVACGDSGENGGTVNEPPLGAGPYPVADLTIRHTNPDVDLDQTYRVSCQGDTAAVTGDEVGVDERAACSTLADPAAQQRLVEGAPGDRACTEIYGGADVATITGTIDGRSVDTTVDRTDGCGIDDWDQVLAGLLPTPIGAAPGS